MKIEVVGRHLSLTEGLKDHIHNKCVKLERFCTASNTVRVVLDLDGERHTAEVIVQGDGNDEFVSAESSDMYVSVDDAVSKMERRLKKSHDKSVTNKKRSKSTAVSDASELEQSIE